MTTGTPSPQPAVVALPEAPRPRVSAVILNYNTREYLRACLQSVERSEPGPRSDGLEVFVVDNASADGSADMVAAEFPWARLIRSPRNGGYAYGNNLAFGHCRGEFVLLLNPDAAVSPNAIADLADYLAAHPDAAVVGPKVLRPDGSLDLACRRSFPTLEVATYRLLGLSRLFPKNRRFGRYNLTYLDPDEPTDVDAVVGACMLVRRSVIEDVGPLDERFFMYGEDLDWALRMKQRGWRILYNPAVTVLHRKGEASRQRSEAATMAFYKAMDTFYRKHYAARHHPALRMAVRGAIWLRYGVSMLKNASRRPGDRRVST